MPRCQVVSQDHFLLSLLELSCAKQELGGGGEAVHRVEERRLNYSFLLIDI